ncbi:TenA family transcriptional regulator [Actinoallomurus soli]|uniref:TenA family transcriptional regulator n=1 Tax=Actinoallomurus soli TaxID=2952535 RepID=UPI00209382E3|nr:iron-containing redox enzyme family protein [Actinoallomurus soli]MCO5970696.1 iron-containing redox enzyme family protein [Actinoallomurus soli]
MATTAGGHSQVPSRTRHHRMVKNELTETPHPAWARSMVDSLRPDWTAVLEAKIFTETVHGPFPEEAWRRILLDFFCVVEAFPKYMGVYLAKTTFGQVPGDHLARDWLIGNIRTEALHAQWYADWAAALGIGFDELVSHRPCPEVGALYEYLWSVCYRGGLAEAFGAVNYAIEGVTGEWTRLVLPAFRDRYGDDAAALRWLTEHAEYDDAHPREAFELIKLTVRDGAEHAKVESAVRRSLELFRRAFDASYENRAFPVNIT